MSKRNARRGRLHRILVVVTVVLVVVACVLVAVVLARGGGDKEGAAASSASSTAVSLDEVAPGSGSLRESEHVPGIHVGYEATCVGAGQAAAGWAGEVLGGVTTQNAAAGSDGFEALLEEEVLAPTWERSPGGERDPAWVAPRAVENYESESEDAEPEPVNVLHAEWGAWRLLTCSAGSDAEVEIYAPLETNGWRGGTPRMREPVEQLLVHRYTLVAVDGEWRASRTLDVAADEDSSHSGQLDHLEDYVTRIREDGTCLTDEAQDVLMSVTGSGSHRYVAS